MRKPAHFVTGALLLIIGLVMLLRNLVVTSFGFFSIGDFNTGGVLIVLLIVCIAAAAAKPGKLTFSLVALSALMILVSVILSTRIYLRHISFLSYVVILAFIGVGAGFIFKSFIKGK